MPHMTYRAERTKLIGEIAEAICESMDDYPNQDPAEIVDEMVRVWSADEELTMQETEQLRDQVWDLVLDRR